MLSCWPAHNVSSLVCKVALRSPRTPVPRLLEWLLAASQAVIVIGLCAVAQGDRLFSQAHDDLFQLNFERQRWGHVVLRPPKAGPAAAAAALAEADARAGAATDSKPPGHKCSFIWYSYALSGPHDNRYRPLHQPQVLPAVQMRCWSAASEVICTKSNHSTACTTAASSMKQYNHPVLFPYEHWHSLRRWFHLSHQMPPVRVSSLVPCVHCGKSFAIDR